MARQTLHHELKTEFHAYFETYFAYELSKHPEYFASVKKISSAILALIQHNRAPLIKALDASSHVTTELFSKKLYGRLRLKNNVSATGGNVLALIINTLNNSQSKLERTLLIHCFFVYRLYGHCTNAKDKSSAVKKIFHNNLFSQRKRTRKTQLVSNKKPGTVNNPVLAKRIKVQPPTHGSPKDQFTLNEQSDFIRLLKKHHLPLASSVSGHTGSLMLGAMLYGNLNHDELREYLVAAFSFLTIARAHTFHEVMVVGSAIGLPFAYDNYEACIPRSIRNTPSYKHVSTLFSQFLPGVSEPQYVNSHRYSNA